MRLTLLLCRQYQFRYWKRYIDRCLYKSNSSEVWHPIVGWKIRRKHPSNFYYDDNRPWTRGFEDNNFISRKKKIDMLVEPIKEWTIFKGDRVEITVGKDKGKQGIVNSIIKERNWVFVEGLNVDYESVSVNDTMPPYIHAKEKPLLVTTQVKLVDPSDLGGTDVEWRYTEDGDRVRVSTRTGHIIKLPFKSTETEDFVIPAEYKDAEDDTIEKELMKVTFKPKLLTFEADLKQEYNIKDDRTPAKTYWY